MKKRYSSISEIHADLERGSITLPQLVEHYLHQIQTQTHINAFVEVFTEEAQQAAQEIQAKWKRGEAGKLAGMVIGIKDNICYKGHKVSASSQILQGFESLYGYKCTGRLIGYVATLSRWCSVRDVRVRTPSSVQYGAIV